jgi:uncharacterized protein YtpQ (UPF0354 family)
VTGSLRRLAKRLGAVLFTGSVGTSALAALSPEAFTQEFVATLRAKMPGCKIEVVKPLEVHVSGCKQGDSTAYLDNAYNAAAADPDSRQEIIERYAASASDVNAESAVVNPQDIVPIIKDRGWVSEMRNVAARRGGKQPEAQVFDEYNEQLLVVYAEDTPSNIRYVSEADLKKAGVDHAHLRELAVNNLRRKLPKVEKQTGPLFSMLTAGGNYEASLLLLDEWWSGDRLKVDGDIVVAVPSRDVLLVTGSRNAAGIAKLRELAGRIVAESNYTLTSDLYVYRHGVFRRLEP